MRGVSHTGFGLWWSSLPELIRDCDMFLLVPDTFLLRNRRRRLLSFNFFYKVKIR